MRHRSLPLRAGAADFFDDGSFHGVSSFGSNCSGVQISGQRHPWRRQISRMCGFMVLLCKEPRLIPVAIWPDEGVGIGDWKGCDFHFTKG